MLQLEGNTIPKGLVSLEELFDIQDCGVKSKKNEHTNGSP